MIISAQIFGLNRVAIQNDEIVSPKTWAEQNPAYRLWLANLYELRIKYEYTNEYDVDN